jgi:hypothetical protein
MELATQAGACRLRHPVTETGLRIGPDHILYPAEKLGCSLCDEG